MYNVSHNSTFTNYIKNIGVLIWDEISMTYNYAFDIVDRLFKDLLISKYQTIWW